MKIGILGTGSVGRTIGARLAEAGYPLMLGARSRNNEKAVAFVSEHSDKDVRNGTFQEAAEFADIVFNCTRGEFSLEVLESCRNQLKNKVLADLANPLDFSHGMPPGLIPELSNINSLGEEIQRRLPDTKVVKTLNTMWSGLMINPARLQNGAHDNFICGNDADAKHQVISILKSFGWQDEHIMDLGDISAARGMESALPFWLRIFAIKKTGEFNFRIMQKNP